ncbi:transposable element Tcb1 transposase [Trichonephila clavipes]|uniref:Transposable element Tcb1 transposase n=1 Tax=Trichonephila clavipes TaxID=2585209 RepID=A0A8X6VVU1_TRICX|nr:transposable element Tcb1 transposase [Trichonephila clavipes]
MWTSSQWASLMFSYKCIFSLQSDSRWTLMWRTSDKVYLQDDNTKQWCRIARLGRIILGSRRDLHGQIGNLTGQIHRKILLKQHAELFRGAMSAEFVFMDDNVHPHQSQTSPFNPRISSAYGMASILT